jgi:site-specific recombinase XerD
MAKSQMVTIVEDFLSDLARAGKSAHTVRAYRGDLGDFARFFAGPIDQITAGVLRAYLGGLAGKAPATRARREAALAALFAWAYRAEMIAADPMTRLDRTRLPASPPRPVPTEQVEAVLRAIPQTRDRDRLLFGLLYTTGMRIGEALAIEVDDLDLSRDDEHVTILGKGGRRRTVLLDDPVLVTLLRRYLKVRGYRHGPLFRAEKNYVGGPLRYASVQELWAKYRAKAQVKATIHQLRHVHATELVNAGVSLETIRRRLGHANAQTVLRYADQRDATTDAEIRTWRRRKITGRPNS